MACLQDQRLWRNGAGALARAPLRRSRGSAPATVLGVLAMRSETIVPGFVSATSRRRPFAPTSMTARQGFEHQALCGVASFWPMVLRSEAVRVAAALARVAEFWGFPYNPALQATPLPASSAFGRSRRCGGAPERERYTAR